MNIRLYNAYILNQDFDIVFGEVHISDGKIAHIGEPKTNLIWDRNIDMNNSLVLHGFSNCHTHSPMTLLRSYSDDLALADWLNKAIFPIEARMTTEDCYYGTLLAILEYLSGGVIAIGDMYFHQDSIIQACLDSGFKIVGIGSAADINGDTESQLEALEQNYQKYNSYSPLCAYKLGFHAQYTASDNLIQGIARLARKYQDQVCAHLSETREEVQSCITRHKMTPPRYLVKNGVFDFGGSAYHCVHLDKNDIELLKEKNVTIVTNPSSNLKLASGIADIVNYAKKGLKIAIGTDGAASNNSLDMLKEIYLTAVLSKVRNNPTALTAKDVLKMAITNGARALGITSGILKEGNDADLTAISFDLPNMRPINNIINNVVYSSTSKNIILTMIKGKILYEKGEYNIGISADEIYKYCDKAIKRLIQQAN
ncbi:MAG TPA: amidohydrolase [Clostridiales bacterium]|nr:amidohydrolase [Clostridiales bacterium]